jgi:hypothetical protein
MLEPVCKDQKITLILTLSRRTGTKDQSVKSQMISRARLADA